MRFALAALLVLPSLASAASARTPFVHEAWTVRDGMPVNSVSSLVQSRSGQVWLGTFDGLVRFDGVRFSTYNVGNTPGLVHNRITSVDELADGRLLLGTDAGVLQLLDPAREQAEVIWTTPVNRPNLVWTGPDGTLYTSLRPGLARVIDGQIDAVDIDPLPDLNVTAMAFGRDSTIWLATEGAGLWRLADGHMQQMAAAETIALEEVLDLLEDDDGRLWVAGRGGVQQLDASGVSWLHDGQQEWRVTTHVLERDGAGRLLLGAESGVYEWRHGRALPVDPDDPRRSPRILALERGASAWRVSASAVFRAQPGSGDAHFEPQFRLADVEASRIVHAMVDDHGSLWLATTGAGLHRLRPVAVTAFSVAEGLSAREVYPLHQDPSGAIWIGTQKGGLNRVLGGAVEAYGPDQGLLDDNIIAIASDGDGMLWVATHEAGLFRRSGDRFLGETDPLLAGAQIRALHLDDRGRLWAGADRGLFVRDPTRGWQRHAASTDLLGCSVRVIRDDGHAIWVGTDRCGVFRIAPDSAIERIPAGEGAGSLYIRDIHLIDADNLWLASEDRGLIRVYREGQGLRAVAIQARDGLPGGGAHQILDDGDGWLWVSTNQGIYRTRQDRLETAAA
ncbi:MAG: hypothetical protein KDI51_06425, partial [Xanthomonadales bacterium]|nr:hypothetical protein [Xanthomonadales bacterium]